jgi:hypothetical protein
MMVAWLSVTLLSIGIGCFIAAIWSETEWQSDWDWTRLRRRVRGAVCRLTGGHDMWHPTAHLDGVNLAAMCASCRRCGHVGIIHLADLPRPRRTYAGVPERHRIHRRGVRHLVRLD